MNNIIWIGIGLNVKQNNPIYNDISKLNDFLCKQYNCKYFFDPVKNQPHINLYDVDIPSKNLDLVKESLADIAKAENEISINLGEVKTFEFGAIFIECFKNIQITNLEDKIVKTINPFRENIKTDDYYQSWRSYSEDQINNKNSYGNPNVLDIFYPHLTLGYVNKNLLSEATSKLNKALRFRKISFNELSLVVHDDKGEFVENIDFKFNQ